MANLQVGSTIPLTFTRQVGLPGHRFRTWRALNQDRFQLIPPEGSRIILQVRLMVRTNQLRIWFVRPDGTQAPWPFDIQEWPVFVRVGDTARIFQFGAPSILGQSDDDPFLGETVLPSDTPIPRGGIPQRSERLYEVSELYLITNFGRLDTDGVRQTEQGDFVLRLYDREANEIERLTLPNRTITVTSEIVATIESRTLIQGRTDAFGTVVSSASESIVFSANGALLNLDDNFLVSARFSIDGSEYRLMRLAAERGLIVAEVTK